MAAKDHISQYLYHGTDIKNVGSIQRFGLRPSLPTMAHDTGEELDPDYPKGVYLTDDPDFASEYGGAVFAVKEKDLKGKWDYTADENASVYSETIPANALKRIK